MLIATAVTPTTIRAMFEKVDGSTKTSRVEHFQWRAVCSSASGTGNKSTISK
jgi:hypothetical protein